MLTLERLNLYEEQLRLSNLIKLSLYTGKDAGKLKDIMKDQEKKIERMVKKQPFDLVDAMNWLVMRKNLTSSKLAAYSLEILCKSPVEKYSNIFAKLINMILKSTSVLR